MTKEKVCEFVIYKGLTDKIRDDIASCSYATSDLERGEKKIETKITMEFFFSDSNISIHTFLY